MAGLVIAGLTLVDTVRLMPGHRLYAVLIQPRAPRPSKDDSLQAFCSCGERLTISNPGDHQGLLALAERNHRIRIGWTDIEPWHGTPNGYVNRGCRCDPCRWAWASYRRGDTPVFPAPVWFDQWLDTSASRVLLEVAAA